MNIRNSFSLSLLKMFVVSHLLVVDLYGFVFSKTTEHGKNSFDRKEGKFWAYHNWIHNL